MLERDRPVISHTSRNVSSRMQTSLLPAGGAMQVYGIEVAAPATGSPKACQSGRDHVRRP